MALNQLLFYDFETNDTDVFKAEILTGYFLDSYGNEYNMKSQVYVWSDDAEKIHGISYGKMKTFPRKFTAHLDLYDWLEPYENTHTFISYSNPNTIYGTISYDRGVLINSMLEVLGQDYKVDYHISVYALVREAKKRGLFTPIRGDKGRASYSQPNVYKAIFNKEYDAHNAKADVLAMKEIYDKVTYALTHNTPITSRQARLI